MATGRDDWVDAAYERFNSGGLGSVRVEVLARDLGTTKGSFYWHFPGRAALVDAVMARWEQRETQQLIEIADHEGTPQERLNSLFAVVAARAPSRHGESTLYITADAEGVGDIVTRVSNRRIEYLAGLLRELGYTDAEARNRGTIALAAVLGLQQLTAASGQNPDSGLTATALRMVLS